MSTPRLDAPTPPLLTSGLNPWYLVHVTRFDPVRYMRADARPRASTRRVGRLHPSVNERRRTNEPSSSRLLVKSLGPTCTGFSPIFGYFALVFCGVQRS